MWIDLGAMLPSSLGQPPATTVTIVLFLVRMIIFVAEPDLQKIGAKKGDEIPPILGLCNVQWCFTWQWQCWIFVGLPCGRPPLAGPPSSPAGLQCISSTCCVRIHYFGMWSPILELTQARMRRGVRTTMRRGTRVKKPTHLFRSRGGRGLPQKGAHVVVSTMLALWMISALGF